MSMSIRPVILEGWRYKAEFTSRLGIPSACGKIRLLNFAVATRSSLRISAMPFSLCADAGSSLVSPLNMNNGPLKCPWDGCDQSFSSERSREDHLRYVHVIKSNGKWLCPAKGCHSASEQRANLMTHYRTAHSRDNFKLCPDCTWKSTDPAQLYRHRQTRHGYKSPGRGKGKVAHRKAETSNIVAPQRTHRSGSQRYSPHSMRHRPSLPIFSGSSDEATTPICSAVSGLVFPFGSSYPWMNAMARAHGLIPNMAAHLESAASSIPRVSESSKDHDGPKIFASESEVIDLLVPASFDHFDADDVTAMLAPPMSASNLMPFVFNIPDLGAFRCDSNTNSLAPDKPEPALAYSASQSIVSNIDNEILGVLPVHGMYNTGFEGTAPNLFSLQAPLSITFSEEFPANFDLDNFLGSS